MQRLLLILALGFSLAVNGWSHGTAWVITQVAHQLGITKDWMELTPSDIDELSNKQARGLAKIEREMWGCSKFGDGILCPITTKNSRDFLKQASVIFARMNSEADIDFFSRAYLGMTIEAAQNHYQELGYVTALWHSGAPAGQ